ncbi:MAG: GNAT family N-acetyltransferase [Saprospiraceae bacterium]|nr:GNAT family N-acetyltransferase [Saprospiraceae bacterium]
MINVIEKHGLPDEDTRQTIYIVYEAIFGKPAGEKVQERLSSAPDLLVLWAENEHKQAVGFKIGYRQDPSTWYSWLGGVLPEYREQGIAGRLMQHQHGWVKSRGYRRIQTKTMNRWRSMLILNLKHGFDIIGTYAGNDGQTRIILQKEIDRKQM